MEDFEQLEIRAKGEFIIFIDGDDFIKPNYLEELYHVSLKNNSEVVIGSYKQFNEEDTKYFVENGIHYVPKLKLGDFILGKK